MSPSAVAMEHILWSAEQGMSPRDVLAAIGCPWEWVFNPTTSYVQRQVEVAWESLSAVRARPVLKVVA